MKQPCLRAGCTEYTTGSYCARHTQTRQQRGYGVGYQRLRKLALERDAYVCAYCGARATTVDHIVPYSQGGINELTNLVASCLSCNVAKRNRR